MTATTRRRAFATVAVVPFILPLHAAALEPNLGTATEQSSTTSIAAIPWRDAGLHSQLPDALSATLRSLKLSPFVALTPIQPNERGLLGASGARDFTPRISGGVRLEVDEAKTATIRLMTYRGFVRAHALPHSPESAVLAPRTLIFGAGMNVKF